MAETSTIIFYFSIFLLATINAAIAEISRHSWIEFIFRLLCFTVIWIPAAIRYDIGTDYPVYVQWFDNDEFDATEAGLYLIFNLVKYFDGNAQWAFAVVAFLTYFPICFGMPKKGYTLIILFFLLIIYISSYNIIRHDLAICIITFAFVRFMINSNSKKYFILFVLLATLIHTSSILCLIFAFIRPIKSARMLILTAVSLIAITLIVDVPAAIFNNSLFLESRYGDYASNKFGEATVLGSGLGVMIQMLIPTLMIVKSKALLEADEKYTYLIMANIFFICSTILSSQIYIFGRLATLFTFAPAIALGMTYSHLGQLRKLITAALIALYIAYFYVATFINGAETNGVFPYQTFFGLVI